METPQGTPSNKRSDSKRSTSSGSRKGSKKGSSKRGSKKGSSQRGSTRRAMPMRHKITYRSQALGWLQPRILIITTVVTLLGVLLQVIAVSTDSWLVLDTPFHLHDLSNSSGRYLLEAYTGLWRLCRVEIIRTVGADGRVVDETVSSCERHNLSPSSDEVQESQDYERQHLDVNVKNMTKKDYTRTAAAFTVIALVIMAIGHAFAFYALRRPRYIIKRLAALLHFMAAASLLVLNEVFVKTIEHEAEHRQIPIPVGSVSHFGFSFVLSWLVFVLYVLAGLVFLLMSHKKKSENVDENDGIEDEPMEIFRR